MKEHTHLHPSMEPRSLLGYYYYDTHLQDLYIKIKIFHIGNLYIYMV